MRHGTDIGLEFNEFSKNYTSDMQRCVPHYMDLLESFVKFLPRDFSPETVLDLGCGNGNTTARLLSRFPEASYTLVDASAEMISLCRKQFSDFRMSYENTYFQDFDFKKSAYDLVVAGFSLHHCDDKEKRSIFSKIHMSLKKGGLFLYSDLMISKNSPEHPKLLEEWGGFVNSNFPDGEKWEWVMEHYEQFDKPSDLKEQLDWLKLAGFTEVDIPYRDGHWVFLRARK
ncbi:class I SAM-dependent methyltransferase [Pontixanthobacter gangjinensis]|uniref:Class I SAM-dependent methyltransferase n=1 Tax=Christiangramia aestuarii TaxID=1028746 RepID=A0A7K1LP00_9FLAO|nr:class I SAM-dependent methyltransferase [Christiangramia aestuarii]MUP42458.1 class I SAM-dependent methyltransferase [Christiangramia aestuarii]